jgi:hypothetical protein
LATRTSKRYPQGRIPGTSTTKEGIQGKPQGHKTLKRCTARQPRSCIHKERNSKEFQVTEPTIEDFPKWGPKHGTKYDPRRIPSAKPKIDTSPLLGRVLMFAIVLSAPLYIFYHLYII